MRAPRTANIIAPVNQDSKSLLALTVLCAFSATLFGLGTDIFSFRSVFVGDGRETLIIVMRVVVYITLALVLVYKGGWWGVVAATVMALVATTAEWYLFPFAFDWAAINDPEAYAEKFGDVGRPSYYEWPAVYDVLGVGIAAILAQGMRMMAHVNPKGPQDE